MKHFLSILFFFSIVRSVVGQDTIVTYYNEYLWEQTHRGDAAYYRIKVTDATRESDTVMDYYITGQLQWKGRLFPDGKSDGLCVWFYKNGDTLQYLNYKNKQANGKFVSFYPKNIPEEIGFYKENEKDSIWQEYGENGELYSTQKFKNSSRYNYSNTSKVVRKDFEWWEADLSYLDLRYIEVDTIWNKNSSIKQIDIKNTNGELIGKISFKDNVRHGVCVLNYSSYQYPKLIYKVTYNEGLFDGEYYYKEENNKIYEKKGNYKNGVKQGVQIINSNYEIDSSYYENDKQVWKVIFKKGLNEIMTSREFLDYTNSIGIISRIENYRLDGTLSSILYDSITSRKKINYNKFREIIQIDYYSADSSSSEYFYKDTTFVKVHNKYATQFDKNSKKEGIKYNDTWIIAPKYKQIIMLSDDYFLFYEDNRKCGVINQFGDTIIQPIYSSITLAVIANDRVEGFYKRDEKLLFIVNNYGKEGLLDMYGNDITPSNCEIIRPSENGDYYNFLILKKDSLYGVYSIILSIEPKYKYLKNAYNGSIIVATGNPYKDKGVLYGVINYEGDEIIPLQYEKIIFRPKDNLIWVKKNNLLGAYNYDGKQVFNCEYECDISNFHYYDFLKEDEYGNKFSPIDFEPGNLIIEVPIVSTDSVFPLIKNKKWGVVNTNGKVVLDFKYDNIKTLQYKIGNPQKSQIVALCEKNGTWGAINKQGSIVIPYKYSDAHEIVVFEKQQDFKNYYKVFFLVELNGKYGVIDDKNNVIIPFEYEYGFVEYTYEEFPYVYFVKDRKQYEIPSQHLLQNNTDEIEKYWVRKNKNILPVPHYNEYKYDYSIYVDSSGLLIVPPIYYHERKLCNTIETLYLFEHVNGEQYILDSNYSFKYKIPSTYEAEKFNDELLYVKTKSKKYGIYNPFTQKLIVDTNYVALFKQESTDLFWVKTKIVFDETGKNNINPIQSNWGLLNNKGQWVLQPEYDFPVTINKQLTKVSENGKFGVINSKGKLLLPCEYSEIAIQDNGLIFTKNSLWSIRDTAGNLICKDLFSYITPYFGNYAMAQTGVELCFISKEGKIVKRFSSLSELPQNKRLIDMLNVNYGLTTEWYQKYYRIYSWNESHYSDFKSFLESYFPSITVEGETFNKENSNMIFLENVALVHILQEYRIIPTLYYLASDEFEINNMIFSEDFYKSHEDYRSEADPWYIDSYPYYGYLTKLLNITDHTMSLESSYRIVDNAPNEYGKKVKSYYVNGRYWEYNSKYFNYVYSKDTLYQVSLLDILQKSNSLDSLINSFIKDSLQNYSLYIKYSKGYIVNKNSFEELPYTELIWDDFVIDKNGISFYISRNNLIGGFETSYYNPNYDIEYIVITIPYEKLKPYIKKGSVLEKFIE